MMRRRRLRRDACQPNGVRCDALFPRMYPMGSIKVQDFKTTSTYDSNLFFRKKPKELKYWQKTRSLRDIVHVVQRSKFLDRHFDGNRNEEIYTESLLMYNYVPHFHTSKNAQRKRWLVRPPPRGTTHNWRSRTSEPRV